MADDLEAARTLKLFVVGSVTCPRGHQEVQNPDDPVENWRFNIKAFRVQNEGVWWSKCLACKEAGVADYWFTENGQTGT